MVRQLSLGVRGKLLALVLVLLLPVVALNGFRVYVSYQSRVESELAQSQALAEAVSAAMVNFLESLWSVELATGLAIAIDQGAHTTDDLNAFLAQQKHDADTVNAFTWVDPNGTVLASTAPHMRGTSVKDREYFQFAQAGQEKIVSDVLTSRATNGPAIVVARRIEVDGRFVGVAVAGVNLQNLAQVLPPLALDDRRFTFADRTGALIYRSDQPTLAHSDRIPHPNETVARALLGETVLTPRFFDPATGEYRMGVAIPLPALGWVFTSSVPHRAVMSDIRDDTVRDLIVLLAVATISTLAALYFSRSILRPVLALEKAARAISTGDLGARVALTGRDEVAAAAQTFNSMAERVQLADEILKARVTAVARLSHEALSGATTEALASAAARLVAVSLGVEAAAVLSLYPNTEKVRVWSAVGLRADLVGQTVDIGYHYLAERVLTQTGPVVLDDLSALFGHKRTLGIFRTAAAVRVPGDEAPFGLLGVASTEPRSFSEADLHFLQAVANVVATAIQRNRTEFEQGFLARAGVVLANSLSVDETVDGVAELITQDLADWCCIDVVLGGKHWRRVSTAQSNQAEATDDLERRTIHSGSAAALYWTSLSQPHIRRRVTDQVLIDGACGDEGLLELLRSMNIVSTIAVPLMVRGEQLGVIGLMTSDDAGFDSRDLALADELARRTALAVDHADMYADLRLLARRQAAIAQLGQTLIRGAGLATVLTEGVALVERELDVHGCRILELQPDGEGLRVQTGPTWKGGMTLPVEIPGQGLTPMGYALRAQTPVIVTDLQHETRFAVPPEVRQSGAHSGACVVIPGGEEPFGVLVVYTQTPRFFTADEVNFLRGIASFISQAVQHERDERRLQTQHAVARIFADGQKEPIQRILQTLCEGLEWDVGFFWETNAMTETARIMKVWHAQDLAAGPFIEACRGFTAHKYEGVVGKVWTETRPFWVADLTGEGAFLRTKAAALSGLHGALVIPIAIGDEVCGVIECFSREVRRPDPNVMAMVTAVARQVGLFLQRQRAEAGLRQLNVELEERVAARTAELETVNQELKAFAYSVSHDLRAPLRTIDGFSQMLGEDYGDLIEDSGRDYLKRIRAAAQKMGSLIDDILRLSRVIRHELRPKRVNLTTLTRSIVAELEREHPRWPPVAVTVADGMTAYGDERLLRLVLENLLRNAWKFTSRSPHPTIQVGVQQQDGRPVFFVKDNGVGFDTTYADKLFDPFQRLHSHKEFEGNGIGLATVLRVIQRHGGRVWAESQVDRGAVFYFTLQP